MAAGEQEVREFVMVVICRRCIYIFYKKEGNITLSHLVQPSLRREDGDMPIKASAAASRHLEQSKCAPLQVGNNQNELLCKLETIKMRYSASSNHIRSVQGSLEREEYI